jgi:hypothetical protein
VPDGHEFLARNQGERREATVEAITRVLLRESENQPPVLAFEDLHWIDAETQALLDAAVESLPTVPALLAVGRSTGTPGARGPTTGSSGLMRSSRKRPRRCWSRSAGCRRPRRSHPRTRRPAVGSVDGGVRAKELRAQA